MLSVSFVVFRVECQGIHEGFLRPAQSNIIIWTKCQNMGPVSNVREYAYLALHQEMHSMHVSLTFLGNRLDSNALYLIVVQLTNDYCDSMNS